MYLQLFNNLYMRYVCQSLQQSKTYWISIKQAGLYILVSIIVNYCYFLVKYLHRAVKIIKFAFLNTIHGADWL